MLVLLAYRLVASLQMPGLHYFSAQLGHLVIWFCRLMVLEWVAAESRQPIVSSAREEEVDRAPRPAVRGPASMASSQSSGFSESQPSIISVPPATGTSLSAVAPLRTID